MSYIITISHDTQTLYIYMVQNTVKVAKECNYTNQSAEMILMGRMVYECLDETISSYQKTLNKLF